MRLVLTEEGWQDRESWVDQRTALLRGRPRARGVGARPGLGDRQAERLSGDLAGRWSRRTDQEHRLVCTLLDGDLVVVQVRYHC